MVRFIVSICSGDALNELHYFRELKLEPDISFIFYDPIYHHNFQLKNLIRDSYNTFFPLNCIYFCSNVNEVRSLLEIGRAIFLIGFNIQESYSLNSRDHNNIESFLADKRKEYGLLNICNLLSDNIKVHIQMKNILAFDNLRDFRQNLINNM